MREKQRPTTGALFNSRTVRFLERKKEQKRAQYGIGATTRNAEKRNLTEGERKKWRSKSIPTRKEARAKKGQTHRLSFA